MSDLLLLLNEERGFLGARGIINTHVGPVDATDARFGDVLQAGGQRFVVVRPTFMDLLQSCRRGAQIVTPKDAAQVVAVTGAGRGWRCVDGGAGSGFLALFLGHVVGPEGRVTTYEQQERFYRIAARNAVRCGLEEVVEVKQADIASFTEDHLDLVTLDVKGAELLVDKVRRHLKPGGWLVVYSPHVEQQIGARAAMQEAAFTGITTLETMQREWRSLGGFTRPQSKGLLHTGFLTLGRRVF
ncbi:MAG: tRNA (adenine-N1)-methyltransferase [Thermoplasmatota archaeon]